MSTTKPFEDINQVLLANVVRVIDIEALKQTMQDILSQVLFQVEGCCEELRVVYLAVAYVVNLSDYLADGAFIYAQVYICHSLSKLFLVDTATTVTIDLLELAAHGFDLLLHLVYDVGAFALHLTAN